MKKIKRPVIFWEGKNWTQKERKEVIKGLSDIWPKGWDSRYERAICLLVYKGTESYTVNQIKFVQFAEISYDTDKLNIDIHKMVEKAK